MRIDDLIILGRTVPEKSKKYGVKVCGAGYSPEMREFIRVYPLPVHCRIHALDTIVVAVDRSKHDSRCESWALKTRDEKSILNSLGKKTKHDIRNILDANVKTIDQLNEDRASLGVIKPSEFRIELKTRASIPDPNQMSLFDDFEETVTFKTAGEYFRAPYLVTGEGKQKSFQLREWGVYELMRKYPEKITTEYIRKALHLDSDKDVFFIVGNMNQFRSVWIVIKAFVFDKRARQLSIF